MRINVLEDSIPTGTIKAQRRANCTLQVQISIPTGTIKRMFQFQKSQYLPNFNSYWYD